MKFLYNTGISAFLSAVADWDNSSAVFKVMLVDSSYTRSRSHQFVSSAAPYELSGAGYSRKTLSGKSISVDSTTNIITLTASDVMWIGIDAGTAAAMILYAEAGASDATHRLIAYFDDQFPITTNGDNVTIEWSDDGIIKAFCT